MAAFARAKLEVLRQVVDLEHGPPSHDMFSQVFRLLDPEPFEAAFARFMAAFAGALEGVVAIEGRARSGRSTAWVPGATWKAISSRCIFIAALFHLGMKIPAALPSVGADPPPKSQADDRR